MELIDKAAVVAEIERQIKLFGSKDYKCSDRLTVEERLFTLNSIKEFINTLEVKEVDLEESARHYLLHEHLSPLNNILHQADLKTEMQYHKDIESAFKAGYEFCLKVQKGE